MTNSLLKRKMDKISLAKKCFADVVSRMKYKYWDIPPLGRRGVYKVKTRALYEKEDKKLFAQVSEYFRNGLIPQSAIRFSMDNSVCEKLYNARLMLLMSFVENNFEDPYELSKIENKKDSR